MMTTKRCMHIGLLLLVVTFTIHELVTLKWTVLNKYYHNNVFNDVATSVEQNTKDSIPPLLLFQNEQPDGGAIASPNLQSNWPKGKFWRRSGCNNWGVVKTIHSPTPAVLRFANMDDWCLIVLADKYGPLSYPLGNSSKGTVVFLSEAKQQDLAEHLDFVKKSHWNHASRKNIAYLFAIANGAEFVWDFDEYNSLDQPDSLLRYTSTSKSTVMIHETRQDASTCGVFNPYPFFRASKGDPWPRGMPIDRVNLPGCKPAPRYYTHEVSSQHLGIVQSLANNNPDRDFVSQLFQNNDQVTFQGPVEDYPVLVPPGAMSPTNSQATLYSRVALWSLFLPSSIHDSVSDIFRSYVAQAIGKRCDMLVAFSGPLVTRDPPKHSLFEDTTYHHMEVQEQLTKLVPFLLEWKYDRVVPTLEGALEQLYTDLYESGYVKLEDVQMLQLWISSLQAIGYKFPTYRPSSAGPSQLVNNADRKWKWTRAPFDDVVLVGQFNYNTGAPVVSQWVRRWREIFKHVDVRGPFDNTTLSSLRQAGINAFVTAGEWGGLYSPMKTMGDSLRLYGNDSSIRGVIMTHDDLLFNVSRLVELGFPSDDSTIGSIDPDSIVRPYMVVYGNDTFRLAKPGGWLIPISNYEWNLYKWTWWDEILPSAVRAAFNDSDRGQYADADGGLELYSHGQSDFLYVPTNNKAMIKEYASYADFMFRNKIMLEIGTPSILGRMQKRFNISHSLSKLATNWGPERNDLMSWMPAMANNWSFYEYCLYHPIKSRNLGREKWDTVFDAVVLGSAHVDDISDSESSLPQVNVQRPEAEVKRPREVNKPVTNVPA